MTIAIPPFCIVAPVVHCRSILLFHTNLLRPSTLPGLLQQRCFYLEVDILPDVNLTDVHGHAVHPFGPSFGRWSWNWGCYRAAMENVGNIVSWGSGIGLPPITETQTQYAIEDATHCALIHSDHTHNISWLYADMISLPPPFTVPLLLL